MLAFSMTENSSQVFSQCKVNKICSEIVNFVLRAGRSDNLLGRLLQNTFPLSSTTMTFEFF